MQYLWTECGGSQKVSGRNPGHILRAPQHPVPWTQREKRNLEFTHNARHILIIKRGYLQAPSETQNLAHCGNPAPNPPARRPEGEVVEGVYRRHPPAGAKEHPLRNANQQNGEHLRRRVRHPLKSCLFSQRGEPGDRADESNPWNPIRPSRLLDLTDLPGGAPQDDVRRHGTHQTLPWTAAWLTEPLVWFVFCVGYRPRSLLFLLMNKRPNGLWMHRRVWYFWRERHPWSRIATIYIYMI
jgi:hypothetical protein